MSFKKTLIAGPWIGEFGWELFAWQGYVRALSRNFDSTIVICAENSKELYEDFASKFVFFNEITGPKDSYFMHGFDVKKEIRNIIKNSDIKLGENTTIFLPRRIGAPPFTHWSDSLTFGNYSVVPEYIKFGQRKENTYDYVFHIRQRADIRPEDNWDFKNWIKLKELLGSNKIACIGTKRSSGWIEGTGDLRDKSTSETLNILSSAKAIFGPSSGPMHLSSLCGCPHVVWSYSGNKKRYMENWNPLKTKVLFLDEHKWHPTAEYVYEKYKEWSMNE